jgi:hypothetical protein
MVLTSSAAKTSSKSKTCPISAPQTQHHHMTENLKKTKEIS